MSTLTIETTLHTDGEGREYLKYTPVLKGRVTASGELRFAIYTAWLDEPETHATQKAGALASAKEALCAIARDAS